MVLLIDNDEDFRNALASLMRDDGYNVLECSDPRHVPPLDSLRPVTALIVEYEMGAEDGISFSDRFHRAHPDAPIVMVSAFHGHALDAQIAARSYITLFRKPLNYGELTSALPAPVSSSKS